MAVSVHVLQNVWCKLTYNFHRGIPNQTTGHIFKGIARHWQPTISMVYCSTDSGSITVSLWCCERSTKLCSTAGLLLDWSSGMCKTTQGVSTNSPNSRSTKGHSRIHYSACEVNLTARTHRAWGCEVTIGTCCCCNNVLDTAVTLQTGNIICQGS